MSQPDLILVIDDNPDNIKVLGNILESRDYEVAAATSGREAFSFLLEEKPALILLDVMMPGLDGFEVCRSLTSDISTRHVPVIFVTARSDTQDVVTGFAAGAVDYISKPFQAEELLARVSTHIALRRAREEVKTLRGLIPICSHCKQIRNDSGFWNQLEIFLQEHTEGMFTHSICPTCAQKHYGAFGREAVREMRTGQPK